MGNDLPHVGDVDGGGVPSPPMRLLVLVVLALAASCGSGTSECCRVCTTGKACGDTCIATTSTCSKPAGCACNGETAEDVEERR